MVRGILLKAARLLPARYRPGVYRLVEEDFEMLLGALLVAASTWTFLLLARAVTGGGTRSVDERILVALRTPGDLADPVGPPWLSSAVADLTSLGSYGVLTLACLAAIVFLVLRRQYHAAALVFATSLGGALIMHGLKGVYDRPRPSLVPHLVRVSSASFPSGHALAATTVYLTLAALLSRLVEDRLARAYIVGVGLTLALIVGFSRVFLGVHYPSDVLGGWVVGLAWAALCWIVTAKLQRRGTVERPAETTAEADERAAGTA